MIRINVSLIADDLKVLVVAPVGRDAKLIRDALAAAGIHAEIEERLPAANARLRDETIGALLVTEEVMSVESIQELSAVIQGQPAWSDLPIIILTIGGGSTVLSRQRERDRMPLGSLTLLERPIRMATLVSGVRSALRSRKRQYEVRDTLIQRDHALASLRDSESRLRMALETARLGAWELDLATGTLETSATFRKIFDWPAAKPFRYEDMLSRIHPEDRSKVSGKIHKAVETNTTYTAEYRVVWRDGNVRWISGTGRLQESAGALRSLAEGAGAAPKGGRFVGVTLDITERVLSETALRNADKLALVGRLASSIAHEINNPLESITNLLYLLSRADLPATEQGYVLMAQQELARVSEITAQTLTFNRQQNAHEVAVATEILDSVLALYQGRLLTSNIRVSRDYRCRLPILCYPGELRQVFTNLIGNAFDATRQGGRIVLRERLSLSPISGEQGLRITVADTGTGMPPEVKSRLFEAFHSTKGNNGTGLGLWISKGIVEKHGGSLHYSSSTAPGHSGTVFSIFLPLRPVAEPLAT